MSLAPPETAQRIDLWLWRARFFKSRTLAAKAVSAGTIRIDRKGASARIDKPSVLVRAGDRLSFPGPNSTVRIIEVRAFGLRRGPAPDAALLFADHSPAPDPAAPHEVFGERKGRPTKKDRRATDRLKGESAP